MPVPEGFEASNRGKCKECGIVIPANRYYCDEHRPAKKQAQPRNSVKTRKIAQQATPVKVIKDIGAAAGSRPPKVPTVEATTKVLGRILVYVTIFIAMALVNGDPWLVDDEAKERQVGELQLKDDDARSIIHPLARALTPTKLWARYGGAIIEHSDVLDALASLYDYASSLARYNRQRKRREAGQAVASTNGNAGAHFTPVPASEGETLVPDQTWGRQIGPSQEQLDEIRRRKAAEWGQAQQ